MFEMINSTLIALFSSMLAVLWIHPRLVKIAHMKNIVDNPDARKLQKSPVPVLGGVAVFFGIVLGLALTSTYTNCSSLITIIAALMIMLYVGTMDDIVNLSAKIRFIIEIGVVLMLIYSTDRSIDDLHGLWGVGSFCNGISIPLTVFATVGIINALNLIDGVNGLSSGYSIMASFVFGVYFYLADNAPMLILASVSIGALIPFFLHNVIGKTSKMFIGDGGTLVMGVVMGTFVVNILHSNSPTVDILPESFGLVPFTLAVMSVPVFDTLRVMLSRIFRGVSPFHPDKTHLHHYFLELGFSHSGTTLSILTLNILVIVCQWLVWYLGGSVDLQLYVVIGLGIAITLGFSQLAKTANNENILKRILRRVGRATHFERKGAFLFLQRLIDKI